MMVHVYFKQFKALVTFSFVQQTLTDRTFKTRILFLKKQAFQCLKFPGSNTRFFILLVTEEFYSFLKTLLARASKLTSSIGKAYSFFSRHLIHRPTIGTKKTSRSVRNTGVGIKRLNVIKKRDSKENDKQAKKTTAKKQKNKSQNKAQSSVES
ncbi:hypothetical protein CEXT_138281 [Caerostris extrusa]|uniref:Uncharacterized protein n=1 Tax=Caerostris extrusa TaxID=172846 RepID=A0AAV4Y3A1_CAEEX|nr:hypothetical protein CEXT_138281 [Caerostris extrusa]